MFEGSIPSSSTMDLHHITTEAAASLIQTEGFKPKSFREQFELACSMTGADCTLVDSVMREYKFTEEEFNEERNVYFFVDSVKEGYLEDYTRKDWSPVNEGLRAMLLVIGAEQHLQRLYEQPRVMLTIQVPDANVPPLKGLEIKMPATEANKYLDTLTAKRLVCGVPATKK